jgi:hypothetical protein
MRRNLLSGRRRLWNTPASARAELAITCRTGMAHTRTHRQLRAEYIAKLGREPGIAVHVLYDELLRLRGNWAEYVELFGVNRD